MDCCLYIYPLPLSKEIARVGDYTCSRTSQASRVRAVNPTELKLYQNYAITSHILVEWGNTIYMNAYDDEDWE